MEKAVRTGGESTTEGAVGYGRATRKGAERTSGRATGKEVLLEKELSGCGGRRSCQNWC